MASWTKYILGSWSWKRPFYSLFAIYLLLLIVVIFFAEKLLFFPPDSGYSDQLNGFVFLENKEQKKVACIYKKAAIGMPTVLWSHGNAEDINTSQQYMNFLNKHGIGIMIYDYPGYGLSEGKITETGCYNNIQAAWDYLTESLKIAEDDIVIVGQSVGSGPSVWLAEQTKPAGLALLSPFKSVNRVPFYINPFPYDRFPNIKRIQNVTAPLLIIHGDQDAVIKQSHGKALHEKHQGESFFYNAKGSGHNDLYSDSTVNDTLIEFIQSVKKKSVKPTT